MTNTQEIINQLEANLDQFRLLFQSAPQAMHQWKSSTESWSLLEILCHLVDEELLDFRTRCKHVLETPSEAMTPIDPPQWVIDHQYAIKDFEEQLAAFTTARKESIAWLNALQDPQWDNVYQHPSLGAMTAAKFLVNWLAHDLLHMRQILQRKFEYMAAEMSNEDLSYAGDW